MYDLPFEMLSNFIDEYNHKFDNFRPTPIDCFQYVKRVLREEFEKGRATFPMDIKIARPTEEMLKGNLEPLKIIHLDKPIMWDETPMWFGDSRSEVFLRFGYENLDARFISKVPLGSKVLHGFLAGATGQGKSVAVNALMCALFIEYAPWELNVHLSDSKILEFKKYGVNHRIPHIKTIAATEDADFVISVLESAVVEMKNRQALFGTLGTSNIKDFRRKTGLALPRILILMDEVETTFQIAGRKSSNIADAINAYTKLGRATGVNLIMATQNYSSDIPAGAMNQISLRMCLGATEAVSEKVLGNKGAAENLGRIGRMIVNTETLSGGDTAKFNTKYQLPFLSDDKFEVEMEMLEQKGKEVGYPAHMSFYDETDLKTVDQMCDIASNAYRAFRREYMGYPVYLGYPAFVSEDKDGLLKIILEFDDIENILLVSPIALNIGIHLTVLQASLGNDFTFLNISNRDAYLKVFDEAPTNMQARSVEASEYRILGYTVNSRLGMDAIDQIAVKVNITNKDSLVSEMHTQGLADFANNDCMIRRFYVYQNITSYKNIGKLANEIKTWFPRFELLIKKYQQFHAVDTWVTKEHFTKTVITLGDINKIIGLGRDSKSRELEALKQLMQEAYRVNIVFVIYASTMTDVQTLLSAFRYIITDSVDSREFGRLKQEDPGTVKDMLCVLFDSLAPKESLKVRKFKRSIQEC